MSISHQNGPGTPQGLLVFWGPKQRNGQQQNWAFAQKDKEEVGERSRSILPSRAAHVLQKIKGFGILGNTEMEITNTKIYCLFLSITRDRRLRLKPALLRDTDYVVLKTHQLTPYLDPFGAYLMPRLPIYCSKGLFIY